MILHNQVIELVRNPKGPELMEKLKQGSFDFEWDECSGYERAICAVQIIVGIVVKFNFAYVLIIP